ncbi:MAG: hypothetical protein AAFQ21_08945 [Pseudomonadota bacterium]
MSLLSILADAADAAGKEDAGGFPPLELSLFPSQIFWLLIFFTLLYLVLSRMILPKLGGAIERREDTIANDLDEATRLDDQSKEAVQALELRMAEAKAKARATAEDAKAKIDADIAKETARIDAEIEKKLDTAEERIAKLRADAMANVEIVAVEAATAIAGRFGVSPEADKISAAVKSALN